MEKSKTGHGKMKTKKTIKIGIGLISIFAVVCIALMLICNQIVVSNAEGKVFSDIDSIKYNKVGLLLGTTPQARLTKVTNYFFIYRIDAAEQLYKAGKIKKILISGDENSLDGINEPECMRDSLVARGIPARAIILDGKGFRTINSIVNANKEYGLNSFTIISQEFHNERAIYQAEHIGLDVKNIQAFNAKMPKSRRAYLTTIREYFARVKMFLDLMIRSDADSDGLDKEEATSTKRRYLFDVLMEGKDIDEIMISLIENTEEFDYYDEERDDIWRLKFCGVPFGININYEHKNGRFIVNTLNLFTSQQSIADFNAINKGVSKWYGKPQIDDEGAGYDFEGRFYGRCSWDGALLRNVHSDEGGLFLFLPSEIRTNKD